MDEFIGYWDEEEYRLVTEAVREHRRIVSKPLR